MIYIVYPVEWFKVGFVLGMFFIDFIALVFTVYMAIVKIKQYKNFLKRHKLCQKFEEEKDYYG